MYDTYSHARAHTLEITYDELPMLGVLEAPLSVLPDMFRENSHSAAERLKQHVHCAADKVTSAGLVAFDPSFALFNSKEIVKPCSLSSRLNSPVAAQAALCSRRGGGGRPTVGSCVHSATAAAHAAA